MSGMGSVGGHPGAGRVGSGSSGGFGVVGGSEAAAAERLGSPLLSGDETLAAVLRGEQTLGKGSRGAAVVKLQKALASLGIDVGTADGAFGPKAVAGIQAVQKKAGLRETGSLDAATLRAIDQRLTGGSSSSSAPRPPAPPAAPPAIDLDAAMRAAAGLPPRAPGTTPVTAPSGPVVTDSGPGRYDNWFTDADELQAPSDVRRYLDQALRTGSHSDIRALRLLDTNMATPAEKARLIAAMLEGHTDAGDEQWILQLIQKDSKEGEKVVDELAKRGKLGQLFEDFQGAEYERLLDLVPRLANDSGTTAALVGAILTSDSSQARLGAHHVLDRARAGKYLDASLAELKRANPTSEVVADIISQAKPTRRPMVVAHRGGPPDHVENTMDAIKAAVAEGDEAVEIDITVTKDNQVVLWHDYAPSGIVADMRAAGMEPGTQFKPVWPSEGGAVGKPIYDLNLDSVRANMGYAPRDGDIFTNSKVAGVTIPRMNDVAAFAKAHPELKTIFLDIKLPPDRPDVQHRFAAALKPVLEQYGLQDRVVLLHNTASVVTNLKKDLGDRYAVSHDVEIVSLAPSAGDYSAVDSARKLGDKVASVGRPRLGIDAYDTYKDVLRSDRKKIDASGKPLPLYTWTINDELEMRELMAIGVDGILTDKPQLLQKLNRIYGFDK